MEQNSQDDPINDEDREHSRNAGKDVPRVSYSQIKKVVDTTPGLSANAYFERSLTVEEQFKSFEAQESLLRLQAERDAFNSYHDLRKQWARILKKLLYGMVWFEVLLTVFVGRSWLKFPNQLFLDLIVGQTFLQIVGMCYIVVKFLFPNDKNPFESAKPQTSGHESAPAPSSQSE